MGLVMLSPVLQNRNGMSSTCYHHYRRFASAELKPAASILERLRVKTVATEQMNDEDGNFLASNAESRRNMNPAVEEEPWILEREGDDTHDVIQWPPPGAKFFSLDAGEDIGRNLCV